MTNSTITPTAPSSVSAPSTHVISNQTTSEVSLSAALEHARRLTEMSGISNTDVAIAWETVEELQKAKAPKHDAFQSPFARYCAANPNALECRIYDS